MTFSVAAPWAALVLIVLITIGQFYVSWKVGRVRSLVLESGTGTGEQMPPVSRWGSYRKAIRWLYRNESGLSVTLQRQVQSLRLIERSLWLGLVLLVAIYGAAVWSEAH